MRKGLSIEWNTAYKNKDLDENEPPLLHANMIHNSESIFSHSRSEDSLVVAKGLTHFRTQTAWCTAALVWSRLALIQKRTTLEWSTVLMVHKHTW